MIVCQHCCLFYSSYLWTHNSIRNFQSSGITEGSLLYLVCHDVLGVYHKNEIQKVTRPFKTPLGGRVLWAGLSLCMNEVVVFIDILEWQHIHIGPKRSNGW